MRRYYSDQHCAYFTYQLNSVYISALIKSFIYISTSAKQPRHRAANTIYNIFIMGSFREAVWVWSERVESFSVEEVAPIHFQFAPNLTISALYLSSPPKKCSIVTRRRFSASTLVWSGVRPKIIVLFIIVLFVLLCDFFFFWLFGKQDEQTFLPQLPFFAAVDERNVNRAAKEVIISRFGLDFSRQGVMSFGPKSQFVTRWINVITLVLRINLFPTQNRWNMESLASMYVEIYAQRTDPSRKKIVTFK